jgi:anti-sigma factor RsiW
MTPETARVLLHAYIDGELDAASTVELESHLSTSPPLRQELARLSALQSALQSRATRYSCPPTLNARLFSPPATVEATHAREFRHGGVISRSARPPPLSLYLCGALVLILCFAALTAPYWNRLLARTSVL